MAWYISNRVGGLNIAPALFRITWSTYSLKRDSVIEPPLHAAIWTSKANTIMTIDIEFKSCLKHASEKITPNGAIFSPLFFLFGQREWATQVIFIGNQTPKPSLHKPYYMGCLINNEMKETASLPFGQLWPDFNCGTFCRFLNIIIGFSFRPEAVTVSTTVNLSFSWPVVVARTSLDPTSSYVWSAAMSKYMGVSSMLM
mgnify:CR=1 FL=1